METSFTYCDKNTAFFSSDERKWINKMYKLKEEHPEEVTILAQPSSNDGCIYAKLPPDVLKIRFKRELSEEQRQAVSERLAAAKQKKV